MKASVFVLLGAIVACADPTAVADESIDDAPVILRFTLARVNDQPLPTDPPTGAGQWDYDGSIVKLTAARLKTYDCVLIATDHSAYDYDSIVRNARLVVDTRNATVNVKTGRHKIVKA